MNFSSAAQLETIKTSIFNYARLPFSPDTIPGAIMEGVLAYARGASVLSTYDFVDVVDRRLGIGWQVKSTKDTTPVTWKRAKIPNQQRLINDSRLSAAGLQNLGDAIIAFCNHHAHESMRIYDLNQIWYSRLITRQNSTLTYFERLLCNAAEPDLFDPCDFEWRWSVPKATVKKEQLQALHGINRTTGEKWWAWHGLGENQLHFYGEKSWWPHIEGRNSISFPLPQDHQKLSVEKFSAMLATLG